MNSCIVYIVYIVYNILYIKMFYSVTPLLDTVTTGPLLPDIPYWTLNLSEPCTETSIICNRSCYFKLVLIYWISVNRACQSPIVTVPLQPSPVSGATTARSHGAGVLCGWKRSMLDASRCLIPSGCTTTSVPQCARHCKKITERPLPTRAAVQGWANLTHLRYSSPPVMWPLC